MFGCVPNSVGLTPRGLGGPPPVLGRLYWDFENVHACLMDEQAGEQSYRASARYRPQDVVIDVTRVADYAAGFGRAAVHRAYVNWQAYDERMTTVGFRDVDRRFPGLVGQAIRLGWSASRLGTAATIALNVVSGVAGGYACTRSPACCRRCSRAARRRTGCGRRCRR